jgi:hypothetical protein
MDTPQTPISETHPNISNLNGQQVTSKRKISLKQTIFITILVFLLAQVPIFIIMKQANNQKIKIPQQSTQIANPKVKAVPTSATQQVASLEVPGLYPKATWGKMDINSLTGISSSGGSLDGMKIIRLELPGNKSIQYPIQSGSAWKAQKILDVTPYNPIESYYMHGLSKTTWATDGSKTITTPLFYVNSSVANGLCGQVSWFVGYDGKEIRVISIDQAIDDCSPPGSFTPNPSPPPNYLNYIIFISDPIPVTTISSYIQAHPVK